MDWLDSQKPAKLAMLNCKKSVVTQFLVAPLISHDGLFYTCNEFIRFFDEFIYILFVKSVKLPTNRYENRRKIHPCWSCNGFHPPHQLVEFREPGTTLAVGEVNVGEMTERLRFRHEVDKNSLEKRFRGNHTMIQQ